MIQVRARLDRVLTRLQRVSSSGRFIPEIDGLRFFAIFSVVCFHLQGWVEAKTNAAVPFPGVVADAVRQGHFGVELFFVLSGFILALAFAEQHQSGRSPDLKRYFLRRLTRLEPTYIANLVLLSALLAVVKGETLVSLAPHFLASVTYIHNLIYGEASHINAVAWSLEVEIQFYLLAPLLCLIFRWRSKAQRVLFLVATSLALSVFNTYYAPGGRYQMSLPFYLPYFLAGLLLVEVYLTHLKTGLEKHLTWDVAGALGAVAFLGVVSFAPSLSFCLPFLLVLVAVSAFRGPILNAAVTNRLTTTMGGMCYTIYLFHYQIIATLAPFGLKLFGSVAPGMSLFGLMAALLLPAIVGLSAPLFLVLEKPFMYSAWPRRVLAFFRPKSLAPSGNQ